MHASACGAYHHPHSGRGRHDRREAARSAGDGGVARAARLDEQAAGVGSATESAADPPRGLGWARFRHAPQGLPRASARADPPQTPCPPQIPCPPQTPRSQEAAPGRLVDPEVFESSAVRPASPAREHPGTPQPSVPHGGARALRDRAHVHRRCAAAVTLIGCREPRNRSYGSSAIGPSTSSPACAPPRASPHWRLMKRPPRVPAEPCVW